jgi:hypothetical protein
VSQQTPTAHLSRLRALLYVALAAAALVAFFGTAPIQAQVLAGVLAPEWRLVPALVFGVALVLYAADRVLLVRGGRYPSGRAFFQVAFGLALLTLLLPGGVRDYRVFREQAKAPDPVVALMKHGDPRVRALAAEVAGIRGDEAHLGGLVELLSDGQPAVRQAARAALERRTGHSMGEGPDVVEAWKRYVSGLAAEQGQESQEP